MDDPYAGSQSRYHLCSVSACRPGRRRGVHGTDPSDLDPPKSSNLQVR